MHCWYQTASSGATAIPVLQCQIDNALPYLFLVLLAAVLFGVVWSITGKECLPGGNLFGIVILFICAVLGGKLVGMVQLPTLPPFPPLLGTTLKPFYPPCYA